MKDYRIIVDGLDIGIHKLYIEDVVALNNDKSFTLIEIKQYIVNKNSNRKKQYKNLVRLNKQFYRNKKKKES